MEPSLALRLEHAFVPGRDDTAAAAVAELLTRPCFAVLRRVAMVLRGGRTIRHAKTTADRIRSYVQDPRCDVVDMDSGRNEPLVAAAGIETGLQRNDSSWQVYPAPLHAHVIVPHEQELAHAHLDAFCELAVALRAMAGCISVEMNFRIGHALTLGFESPNPERDLQQPGMTLRRIRERATYDMKRLDREIPAPEWGLFLGRGHLDILPADTIEATGAFHQVRRLGDDLVFLQLTPDPADALREDFDQILDRARNVLAPVLADASGVTVEGR